MRRFLARFRLDQDGATAIEYGLIAALVVVVMLTALTAFGDATADMYERIRTEILAALAGAGGGG